MIALDFMLVTNEEISSHTVSHQLRERSLLLNDRIQNSQKLQFPGLPISLNLRKHFLLFSLTIYTISVNFSGMTRDDLFNTNASIVQTLSEACAK